MGGLSAGTYTIELRMPYDQQNYLGLIEPAAITNFVVNANGSVTYNSTTTAAASLPVDFGDIEFRLAAKTITGRVTKTDGTAVNNVRIRAFKMKDPGMAQTTTNSSGNYTLTVGGGTWMIMPEIDWYNNFDDNSGNNTTSDWVYCGRPKNVTFAENVTTESSTSNNFEVKIANATITGRVAYPDGTALNGSASVDIFSRDGCGSYASVNYSNGTFSSTVPPGTYNLTAGIRIMVRRRRLR